MPNDEPTGKPVSRREVLDCKTRSQLLLAGYAEASAFPGSSGTTIVTGHQDTHFRFLRRLKVGDDAEGNRLVLVTYYLFDTIVPSEPLWYVVLALSE